MLNEFASSWFDETSRWVDATIKTAATESPENKALLAQWVAKWRTAVLDALKPLAIAGLGDDAHHALEHIAQTFDARVAKQGVEVSHG